MATNNTVSFTINFNGNAYNGVVQLGNAVNQTLNPAIRESQNLFHKIGDACFRLNNIFDMVGRTVGRVVGKLSEFEQAGRAQAETETKLAQVMRNTMGDDIVRRYGNVETALKREREAVENLSLSFKELPVKVGLPKVEASAMEPLKIPVEIQPTVTGADAFGTAMERIRKLTADQQRKGVIGDEIQIAGAQELSTYLTKLSSLEKLIPVMNDMVAQQYGYNASQESAVGIATMMGKVMDGQVGALSRYGYKFDEAQEKILKFGTEEQRAATLAEVVSGAVGGVNEALANTPEGRVVQLNNAYGDLQERLGGLWTNLKDTLFPVFDDLIQRADGLIDVIEEKMGAVKEWILGAVEWLSGVWDSVKEPVMNTVTSLWGSLRSIVGNIVNTITGIVRNHSTVIRGIVGAIGWTIRTVGNVLAWVSGLVTGFVNFVSNNAPLVLGFAGALGILTLATKAQAIEQSILNGATMLGVGIGKLLGGTIAFVNAVMAANPVYWIIAGIVALAGVIVFLAIKVKGWGTLWEAVVNFATHTFTAFTYLVKQKWNEMTNGLMIGLDKIKEGWYKFRKAVGIGDESENDAALAKIAQDVKARQQKIADGSKQIREELKAARDSWKGVDLKWDKKVTAKDAVAKIKADLGITDQSAVTNILNDQSTGDTELNSELSDASTKISSGGKNIKNINITINDGLVHGVQNYFNSSDDNPDTASDFMWRLANALQLVVNDVNYD
jgi:Phage-related protein